MESRLEARQEALSPLTWRQREVARAWVLKALAEAVTEEQWQRAISEAIQVATPRKREAPTDGKAASTGGDR